MTFKKYLRQDNHTITLHVYDGVSNKSISVNISVIPDPNPLDTDQDGIPDFKDDDDDNDGLLDIQEDLNNNGFFDFDQNETNSKIADNDFIIVSPPDPEEESSPFPMIFLGIFTLMLIIGSIITIIVIRRKLKI